MMQIAVIASGQLTASQASVTIVGTGSALLFWDLLPQNFLHTVDMPHNCFQHNLPAGAWMHFTALQLIVLLCRQSHDLAVYML